MKTGNSVREVDPRCAVTTDLPGMESVEAMQEPASLALSGSDIPGGEKPARPPFQHVKDIQELIDKLAAVTKQLHDPGHS
jgi:hypothetical protein